VLLAVELPLELVEEGELVLAISDCDSRLALLVDAVVEDGLLVEPGVLLLVEAMLCDVSLWPVWPEVDEPVVEDGDVEELVLAGSVPGELVLDCAMVEGDDEALGLLTLDVDAVRELSSWLGKSERRSEVVMLSASPDLISSLLNGTRKSPSSPAKLSSVSISTIAFPD
jgi:hypothetical protein